MKHAVCVITSHKGGAGVSFLARNLRRWILSHAQPATLLSLAAGEVLEAGAETPRAFAAAAPQLSEALTQLATTSPVIIDVPLAQLLQWPADVLQQLDDVLLVLPVEPLAYRALLPALRKLTVLLQAGQLKGILLNQPVPPASEMHVFEAYLQKELKPYLFSKYVPHYPEAEAAVLAHKELIDLQNPADSATLHQIFKGLLLHSLASLSSLKI
jgi:hypothetical protein